MSPSAAMIDDYAYVNARIRAMKAQLLGPKAYDEMLALADLPALHDYLGHTAYQKSLGTSPTDGFAQAVEEALRAHWSRTLTRVHGMTGGRLRRLLEIFLGQRDVENIKLILRGKKADAGISAIMSSVLPTGVFDEEALAELARQSSLHAVVDLLATWRSPYAKPLKEVLMTHRELGGLEPLELALDRYYFESALKELEEGDPNARYLKTLMGLRVDRANILTGFKIFSEGMASPAEIPSYFIKGGYRLPRTIYDEMIRAQSLGEVAEVLRRTFYASLAVELEAEQGAVSPPVRLERGLDRFMPSQVESAGLSDPLGIGLTLVYLMRQHREISNIRILLKGKAYGMYPEDIRSLLIL